MAELLGALAFLLAEVVDLPAMGGMGGEPVVGEQFVERGGGEGWA